MLSYEDTIKMKDEILESISMYLKSHKCQEAARQMAKDGPFISSVILGPIFDKYRPKFDISEVKK